MLKFIWKLQLSSRGPPLLTPIFTKSFNQTLNVKRCGCHTDEGSLDFKRPKIVKRRFGGVRSTFKHLYNVSYDKSDLLYRERPELRTMCKKNLNDIVSHLKKLNYEWEEVRKIDHILLLPYYDVDQRFQLFDDWGFPKPSLHEVLLIKAFFQVSIEALRTVGFYEKDFNIAHQIIQKIEVLDLSKEVTSEIWENLQDIEKCSLGDIHQYILAHYLSKKFGVDLNEVKDMIRMTGNLFLRPFSSYPPVCDIIKNVLNIDLYNVMDQPFLLNIDPVNAQSIVKKYSKIGGTPIVDVAKNSPRIFQVPYRNLVLWLRLFKRYKVKRFMITPQLIEMFHTVQYREIEEKLQILQRMPEFQIITNIARFSELLQKPYLMKRVVEMLHRGHHFSQSNLFTSKKSGPHTKKWLKEAKILVAKELGMDVKDPKLDRLREVPGYLGLLNTEKVLKILQSYGFTEKQIIDGIEIVSFEYETLRTTLKQFSSLPEVQPFEKWMKEPNVVHLLAYFTERNSQSKEVKELPPG